MPPRTRFAFARDPAQHGIDQRLEMHRLVVGGGQLVGGIHRGMRRALSGSEARRPPAAGFPSPVPPCAAPAAWARNGGSPRPARRNGARSRSPARGQNRHRAAPESSELSNANPADGAGAAPRTAWQARPCAQPGLRDPPRRSFIPRDRAAARCTPAMARSRAMRSSVEGWLANKPLKATMQRIDDEHMRRGGIGVGGRVSRSAAPSGRSAPAHRPATAAGRSVRRRRGRLRTRASGEIAACTSMAAMGASKVTSSTPTRPSGLRRSPPMKKAKLASMPMAPAITAVMVMVRVSRLRTWPSSCAITPASSSLLTGGEQARW